MDFLFLDLSPFLTVPAFLLATGAAGSLVPLWVMELAASLFLYAWLLCVGASVGSFINVVVYRLPRGKSLIRPGSFCPQCGRAIRLRDNIPIVSWLALRGRCRDCQSPIAARYFWVELTTALIFLTVAVLETNLTGSFPQRGWDASRWLISPYETLPFWSTYVLHVALLATLLCAALIDGDGFATPGRVFVPVVAAAILLPALWAAIYREQPLFSGLLTSWTQRFAAAMRGWAAGLACGAVISLCWSLASRRGRPRFAPAGLFIAAGVVIGWRSTVEAAAASMLLLATGILAIGGMRGRVHLPLAAVVMLAVSPRLLDLDVRLGTPLRWPAGYDGTLVVLCAAVGVVGALLAGWLAPAQYHSESVPPHENLRPAA